LLSLPLEEGRESERTRESLGSLSGKFEQKTEQELEQKPEQPSAHEQHKARLAQDPRFAAWTAGESEASCARVLGAKA